MTEEKIKISLAAARVNAGLLQKDVAKELGIDKATLISYEKGKTNPKWEIVLKMEKLYGISKDNIKF